MFATSLQSYRLRTKLCENKISDCKAAIRFAQLITSNMVTCVFISNFSPVIFKRMRYHVWESAQPNQKYRRPHPRLLCGLRSSLHSRGYLASPRTWLGEQGREMVILKFLYWGFTLISVIELAVCFTLLTLRRFVDYIYLIFFGICPLDPNH